MARRADGYSAVAPLRAAGSSRRGFLSLRVALAGVCARRDQRTLPTTCANPIDRIVAARRTTRHTAFCSGRRRGAAEFAVGSAGGLPFRPALQESPAGTHRRQRLRGITPHGMTENGVLTRSVAHPQADRSWVRTDRRAVGRDQRDLLPEHDLPDRDRATGGASPPLIKRVNAPAA